MQLDQFCLQITTFLHKYQCCKFGEQILFHLWCMVCLLRAFLGNFIKMCWMEISCLHASVCTTMSEENSLHHWVFFKQVLWLAVENFQHHNNMIVWHNHSKVTKPKHTVCPTFGDLWKHLCLANVEGMEVETSDSTEYTSTYTWTSATGSTDVMVAQYPSIELPRRQAAIQGILTIVSCQCVVLLLVSILAKMVCWCTWILDPFDFIKITVLFFLHYFEECIVLYSWPD